MPERIELGNVYVVGGIVKRGYSKDDIDIIVIPNFTVALKTVLEHFLKFPVHILFSTKIHPKMPSLKIYKIVLMKTEER